MAPKASDAKRAEKPTLTTDPNAPQPIGVPVGYQVPTGPDVPYFQRGGIGPTTPERIRLQSPRYMEGDDWTPAGRGPDKIAELQQAMVDAGVLTTNYHKGVWDDASRAAYRDVLSFANGAGVTDTEAISRWADSTEQKGQADAKTFDPLPFRPPDPATLRQTVKKAFKDILPRELKESEIEYLTSQASSLLSQEHAAEEGFRRSQFEAEGTGEAPAAVPQADADARFRELLETRYKPQINLVRQQGENVDTKEFIGKSLRAMGSMIGGGESA